MELGLNLDDEDFYELEKKSKEGDIDYIPRNCYPNWFVKSNNPSETSALSLPELKFAADSAYTKKKYNDAIILYHAFLEESNQHKVTRVQRKKVSPIYPKIFYLLAISILNLNFDIFESNAVFCSLLSETYGYLVSCKQTANASVREANESLVR